MSLTQNLPISCVLHSLYLQRARLQHAHEVRELSVTSPSPLDHLSLSLYWFDARCPSSHTFRRNKFVYILVVSIQLGIDLKLPGFFLFALFGVSNERFCLRCWARSVLFLTLMMCLHLHASCCLLVRRWDGIELFLFDRKVWLSRPVQILILKNFVWTAV